MDQTNMTLQALGTNEKAKEILRSVVTGKFSSLDAKYAICDQVIEKFYDWQFPFLWTEDGGSERRWKTSVSALCGRWEKLSVLDDLFSEVGGTEDGSFSEEWSGNDTDEFEDHRSSKRTSTLTDNLSYTDKRVPNGVFAQGSTESSAPAESTTHTPDPTNNKQISEESISFDDGKNKTVTTKRKGTKRTYSDGRTILQRIEDVEKITAPVYAFVNAFAEILVEPCELDCGVLTPTMQASAEASSLPEKSEAEAEVENLGSPLHAKWKFKFKIPASIGPQGPQGPAGSIKNLMNFMITFSLRGTGYILPDPVLSDGSQSGCIILDVKSSLFVSSDHDITKEEGAKIITSFLGKIKEGESNRDLHIEGRFRQENPRNYFNSYGCVYGAVNGEGCLHFSVDTDDGSVLNLFVNIDDVISTIIGPNYSTVEIVKLTA